MIRRRRSTGGVLVVVLGVLLVLALLATTFAVLQAMERKITRNYLDTVRARLVAQSGVEAACAELQTLLQRGILLSHGGPQPWGFWGDDVFEAGAYASTADLRWARNPSFAAEKDGDPFIGTPEPREITIEGRRCGFSGVLSSGTYARNGDVYTIKVTDSSGKIYLNEGLHEQGGNESSGSRNLRRILNRLGAAMTPPVAGLGDRIVTQRPLSTGYPTVTELRRILDRDEYERARVFLTAHAWTDPNAVNPVPFSPAHAAATTQEFGITYYRGQPPVYRFGRGKDYLGNLVKESLAVYPAVATPAFKPNTLGHAVYAMDELNPMWIERVSRAPVNVNAAPREVLIALLSDLRGVFLSERRRNNFATEGIGAYHYLKIRHSYSPANMPMPPADERPLPIHNVPEGDEVGFLYETYPIVGPGSPVPGISAADIAADIAVSGKDDDDLPLAAHKAQSTPTPGAPGIPADDVADEIIACREKRKSPVTGFDYGNPALAPFAGPFRSWRQFNAFCDNLVTTGILRDPRKIYYDHRPVHMPGGNITGYAALDPSDFQRAVAAQAIADALKANFNPNVHLNELNPDRNMHLLVDKTDLSVHSTEFVFLPTGYYDIEAIGYLLHPATGADSLAAGVNNDVVAQAEIEAGIRLFDIARTTAQSQFARGECSGRRLMPVTNNGLSLEIGPEPDNGNGPLENDWGGYLALPTAGGTGGVGETGGAPRTTPAGPQDRGEMIHAHFSLDFDAHYHADGIRGDLGSHDDVAPNEHVENFPDPDPSAPAVKGPYDPTDNGGNYYRLARSFVTPSSTTSSTLAPRPPLDLRIDGAYVERHAGLAYWISIASYAATAGDMQGAIAYWVKPNFDPARSGKPRLYVDMGRYSHGYPNLSEPVWKGVFLQSHFTQFWNAGHDALPGDPSPAEDQAYWFELARFPAAPTRSVYGMLPFKPQSFVFGTGYGKQSGHDCVYVHSVQTPSLNHKGHLDEATAPTTFDGHCWTHVILSWQRGTESETSCGPVVPSLGTGDYRVIINGQYLTGELEQLYTPDGNLPDSVNWTLHPGGDQNSLRLGSPSRIVGGNVTHYNNMSADSTLDEFYFWNRKSAESDALQLWLAGRYAFPQAEGEGMFTSAPLKLEAGEPRFPAPASSDDSFALPAPDSAAPRILGVSWTWFAEGSERGPSGSWVPFLTDHGPLGGSLYPRVEFSLPGLAPVEDDGFSLLRDAAGNPPTAAADTRYRLQLRVPGAGINTVLLATPVIDDVTLYYVLPLKAGAYTHYRCAAHAL